MDEIYSFLQNLFQIEKIKLHWDSTDLTKKLKMYEKTIDDLFYQWSMDIYIQNYREKELASQKKFVSIMIHRVFYEKNANFQYNYLRVFEEKYVFRISEKRVVITSFSYEEYMSSTSYNVSLTLDSSGGELKCTYSLSGEQIPKIIYAQLADEFKIIDFSENIEHIEQKSNYIIIKVHRNLLQELQNTLLLIYTTKFFITQGIFQISKEFVFLHTYCGFFPLNINCVDLQIICKIPVGFKCITNGYLLREYHTAESSIYEWIFDNPDDLCCIISRLNVVKAASISLFSQSEIEKLEANLIIYEEIYSYFHKFFDYDIANPPVSIVETDRAYIDGMSFKKMLVIDRNIDDTVSMLPKVNIIAHEIVHQWWGNNIQFNGELQGWLKESITEYLKNIYLKEYYSLEVFQNYLDQAAGFYFAATFFEKDFSLEEVDVCDTFIYNSLIYGKGVYIVHMLVDLIGINSFRDILRYIFDKNLNSIITYSYFIDILREFTDENVCLFLKQWLVKRGVPVVNSNYTIHEHCLELVIKQDNEFVFPLEIGLLYFDGIQYRKFWVTAKKNKFKINLDSRPDRVIIDPRRVLLHKTDHFMSEGYILAAQLCETNLDREKYLKKSIEYNARNIRSYYFLCKYYDEVQNTKMLSKYSLEALTLDDPVGLYKSSFKKYLERR